MSTLDLESWIDAVHAKLDERMSNRYPSATETTHIAYSHLGSSERAIDVPRVEWGDPPNFETTYRFDRAGHGHTSESSIGTCIVTQEVEVIAADMADCRALVVNLLQAMILTTTSPRIHWPIDGVGRVKDVSDHGRLSRKITLTFGVELPIPSDPQEIATWSPTGPGIEVDVDAFNSKFIDPVTFNFLQVTFDDEAVMYG